MPIMNSIAVVLLGLAMAILNFRVADLPTTVSQLEQQVVSLEQQVVLLEQQVAAQQHTDTKPEPQRLDIVHTGQPFDHVSLDRFCLAKNIYHEARGESVTGQYAVAQVTINRVKHPLWPDDICHVVMQPWQFSWTADRDQRWTHPTDAAWYRAQQIAADVLDHGARVYGLDDAVFYHAVRVNPAWGDRAYMIAQIDDHVFYHSDLAAK